MMPLLDLAIRTSAPVVAGLAACLLLRSGSAALRHRVLAVAAVAVVAIIRYQSSFHRGTFPFHDRPCGPWMHRHPTQALVKRPASRPLVRPPQGETKGWRSCRSSGPRASRSPPVCCC